MTVLSDYTSGTISLAQGSVTVTGTGTLFQAAQFREGDTLQVQNLTAIIKSVDSNTQLTLAEPWTGTTLSNAPYRARFMADNERVAGQSRNVIELLGNGVLSSIAEIPVQAGKLLIGNSAGFYDPIDRYELGGGGAGGGWDATTPNLAGLDGFASEDVGFRVLVIDNGTGRAAVYERQSAGWSPPIYFTGPSGANGQDGAPGRDGTDGEQGIPGQDGTSFEVDASGTFSERSTYDSQPLGFSFLATDQGNLYLREGVVGEWSEPIPFGKGEKGDQGDKGDTGEKGEKGDKGDKGDQGNPGSNANVTTSTVGAAVAGANGREVFNDADAVTGAISGTSTLVRWTWGNIKAWIKGFITKADVGLEKVANKSEAEMVASGPISDAISNVQPKVGTFPTRAAAMSAILPTDISFIEIKGWNAVGDGGGALYAVRSMAPAHPGMFVLQGGKYAEIAMTRYEPRMFGAKSDYNVATGVGTDNAAALQNMLDTSKAMGGVPMVISGRYRINSGVTLTNSQCSIVGDWFSGSIIASPITTGSALNVTQDTYLNGTHIEGITFVALALQTAGSALRVSYSATDSVNNRSSVRCVIDGVNAIPRLQGDHSWRNGILLRNVHNATLKEINAAGGRNFSLPETDLAHWTRMNAGIQLEADTGMTAIPSDIYIVNSRVFHATYGIQCTGEYEGLRIDNPILVAVNTGVHCFMTTERPWMQVDGGHINYFKYGVYAANIPQSNFDNLLLYKFQNSRETSSGIVLSNCPHSQIDNIRCYNLCTDAAVSGEHNGITLVAGSSYCTIGDLIITNPSHAVIIWNATTGCRIKSPLLQGVYPNSTARNAVTDNSTGFNEYGGQIAAANNASVVSMGTASTSLTAVTNLTLSKGERVRVTVSISGNRSNAGTVYAAVQPGSTDGGIGVFGQTGANLPNKYFGATGDWDMTFSGVFSCVNSGTFSLTLQGISAGTASSIAANRAQMLIERM